MTNRFGPEDAVTSPAPSSEESKPATERFTPGETVAGRYRIVGLLGEGGMGAVYRADDLRLGTAVALKFLPPSLERDQVALERFRGEVRTARQVSHPHVCRVFDIDDVGGHAFISMEYVDGEDLGKLLSRIGRLPPSKAIEISRQLCAGLSAAHDKGLVHRDLKPANVMIDGHGRARITDFGLAVPSGEAVGDLAGTPAYMAPEQLSRNPATIQSDIYALGLVLFEMFTGTRAFEASDVGGWLRAHTEMPPPSPSRHTSDLDPAVERIILRCLEKDPAARPRSVAQIAMALPGGDPVAAAIAAGETPSPEMVAAAGGEGALTPATGWMLLAVATVLVGGIAALSPYSTDLGLAPMKKSPAVLEDRAQAVLERFGYSKAGADEVSWLERDYSSIRWMANSMPSIEWRRRLASTGAPVLLFYRRGDVPLVPLRNDGLVTTDDPPRDAPGSLLVVLDAEGRLRMLQAMSARWSTPVASAARFSEDEVFQETGLDRARFESAAATWVPPLPFDDRREWIGSRVEAPDVPLRLSVASLDGRLVSLEVLGPWSGDSIAPVDASWSARIRGVTFTVFVLSLMAVMTAFARRNLRAGRGDRAGAFRLASASLSLSLLVSFLPAHWPPPSVGTVMGHVFGGLGPLAFLAMLMWLFYIAFEPYVRRRMPDLLVGWARLLEGRVGDPRVGRDVLVGLVTGLALAAADHLVNALPTWFSFPGQTTIPFFSLLVPGASARFLPGAALVGQLAAALTSSLFMIGMVFICRLLTPRPAIATVVSGVVFSVLALGEENAVLETPSAILHGALLAFVIARLGLLPLVVTVFTDRALVFGTPVGVGFSTWYAPYAIAGVAVILFIAVSSFVVSLGGRSPFGSLKLDA